MQAFLGEHVVTTSRGGAQVRCGRFVAQKNAHENMICICVYMYANAYRQAEVHVHTIQGFWKQYKECANNTLGVGARACVG